MFNKKRLRNYGLWVGVISKLVLIAQLVAILLGYPIPQEKLDLVILIVSDGILGILVLLGVISNPTKPNKSGFNL